MAYKEKTYKTRRERTKFLLVGRNGSDYDKALWDFAESKGLKLSVPEFWEFRNFMNFFLEIRPDELNDLKKLKDK